VGEGEDNVGGEKEEGERERVMRRKYTYRQQKGVYMFLTTRST